MALDAKTPDGPLKDKWSNYKAKTKLVNPANRKKIDIIVVGAGLSGGGAAASLSEMGYNVKVFFFQDTARRSHSVAAQGGVNAAKNYRNDGDNVYRMFYDTVKGGDFRSRESNVHRMAECSVELIDHMVAQGVPFGREYSGYLSNRSFGGVLVSRTFYARGQTGQQLLLATYQAMMKQVKKGNLKQFNRHEMLDLVMIDGKARGIIARNLVTGEVERHAAHAVVLGTGGFGKIYYLSTLAMNSNGSATWRAHKKGAYFANPSWTQIHPTALPQAGDHQSKLTLMSESLRNDGRIWVPKRKDDDRLPGDIPAEDRDYYLERRYPAFGNLVPRDVASRAAKERMDAGFGVGSMKNAVYLDFKTAIARLGIDTIKERYGNLFTMYRKITGIDAYKEPMKISPAAHFSMGGLWVDYELQTTIPGLFAVGEANFADHGANRLGANSLLQASVDGNFVLPNTIPNYLSDEIRTGAISTDHPEFAKAEKDVIAQVQKLLDIKGTMPVDNIHRRLGKVMFAEVAMSRNEKGLIWAIEEIKSLKKEFWSNVAVPGDSNGPNSELEKAGRLADYLEIAQLMAKDALDRKESCGAHFREEYQTEDGEAVRNDEEFMYSAAWEWTDGSDWKLHKEELDFKDIKVAVRSYK
ncbi:MAG: fumarate reductase/succinate dehydrogenase flavoprotein subunit [Ichthyobacteriaceae bacterium]|nr:fumarate reductase/succinate dehydrogenase flavoprotein subunit [Ichthyobacteriaceae bacterium]